MFKRIVVIALASVLATGALAENLPSTGTREQGGDQPKPLSGIGQRTREVLTDAAIVALIVAASVAAATAVCAESQT